MLIPRGAAHGINWSHPANKNLVISWVAGRGLAQYDLTRRQIATIGGSGAVPTAIVSPHLGPAVSIGNANVTIKWPTIYNSTAALQTVTFAFILKINAFGSGFLAQCSNATDAGLTLYCPNTFQVQDRGGGGTYDSGITLSTGVPYLLVFSQFQSASGYNGYFMVVPLDGSAAPSYANSALDTTTFHAGDGGFTLGNYVGSGFGATADISAFLVSKTYLPAGGLNPVALLNRWARDPWGPWRPQSAPIFAFNTSGGGISGSLTATEGNDSLTASGVLRIAGSLTAIEADDTATGAGVLPIVGTLSIAEVGDISAGAGVLSIKGLSSVVEADDTASGAGVLPIAALLLVTEAGDALSSAGSLPIVGTLVITDADDTASGAGVLPIQGLASIVEAGDTVAAAGALPINGFTSVTEADDTAGGAGVLPIVGSLYVVEASDTLFATSSATNTISGVLSITEDGDSATGASVLPIAGLLSVVEANDVLGSAGVLLIKASASLTEANDAAGGAGSTTIVGSLSIIEANDILTSVNFVGVQPQFIRVEQESLLASKITFDSLLASKVVGESLER